MGHSLVFCGRLLVLRGHRPRRGAVLRRRHRVHGGRVGVAAGRRGGYLDGGWFFSSRVNSGADRDVCHRHERRRYGNCGWKRGVQPVDHYRRGDLGLARTEDDSRSKSINTRCGLLRRYDCGAGAGVPGRHGGDRRGVDHAHLVYLLRVPVRDLDVHREAHFTSFLRQGRETSSRGTGLPERRDNALGEFPRRRNEQGGRASRDEGNGSGRC